MEPDESPSAHKRAVLRERLRNGGYVLLATAMFGLFLYGALRFRSHPYFPQGYKAIGWEITMIETLFLFVAILFGWLLYLTIKRFMETFGR